MEAATLTRGLRVLTMLLLAAAGTCALVHKTIQIDDGDAIDCVDIYHQPAFKHAPPGRREIQAKPQWNMKAMAAAASASKLQQRPQAWRKHGRCPAGTVPIRRASRRGHANPHVAEQARRASPFGRPAGGSSTTNDLSSSILDAWKGKVEAWPSLFGDSLSRLFVYYTTDGGTEKNCFNLDCGGFHLHESQYVLGDSWADSDSQVGGRRFYVTLGIHRDSATENWWVTVMDEEIGYYPETVFNTMFPEAVYVEMGGRVLNTRPDGNHTTTPMGSGMPACGGSRFAAAIMEYLGVAYDGTLFNDPAKSVVATTPSCYGANPLGSHKTRPGYNSAYGGPGGIFCDRPE